MKKGYDISKDRSTTNIQETITLYHGSKSGIREQVKGSPIYEQYKNLSRDRDMIIGNIANDRMFVVLDRFFSGDITDLALINSLSALKLGKQYVALTKKACSKIQILDETELSEKERSILKKESEANPAEVMYWAGYTYRYWHYYTGETSQEIYKTADAKTMDECWLGFHTLDVAMAVDDLKEIFDQKHG